MSTVRPYPILLPKITDMSKWAVIACDQYTTDKDYWTDVEKHVANSVSTLRLIFPEIYLKDDDAEKRIIDINRSMSKYLDKGVFEEKNCYVLTERMLSDGRKRIGLIASVDLEDYDYKNKHAKIRSTEQTIEERLPIRIHIRENAPLELPHVLLLTDDKNKSVIFPLYNRREEFKVLYDFDLYPNGGHIRGFEIPFDKFDPQKFEALLSPELQKEKYGKDANILFAVGDGNHSMAAAKLHWENVKATLSKQERENHPARFMLVEILNVYDEALDFLPIHRNIFCSDVNEFVTGLKSALSGNGKLTVITENGEEQIACPEEADKTIIAVQNYLEKEKKEHDAKIEYVHEEQKVRTDGAKKGGVGILMPSFPKETLFPYVVNKGKLPKKAFSMGEERNKKYYIEAKRIK